MILVDFEIIYAVDHSSASGSKEKNDNLIWILSYFECLRSLELKYEFLIDTAFSKIKEN
jgi:hypothetical protein